MELALWDGLQVVETDVQGHHIADLIDVGDRNADDQTSQQGFPHSQLLIGLRVQYDTDMGDLPGGQLQVECAHSSDLKGVRGHYFLV